MKKKSNNKMTSDIKFHDICQCCLTEEGLMKNMLTEPLHDVKLIEGFKRCSGIELLVQKGDSQKNICEKCEQDLKVAFEFRERCHTSQQILRERSSFIVAVKDEPFSDDDTLVLCTDSATSKGSEQQFTQVFVKHASSSAKVKCEQLKSEEPTQSENMEVKVNPDDMQFDSGKGKHQSQQEYYDESKKPRRKKPKKKKSAPEVSAPLESVDVATFEASYMCYHCDEYLPTHNEYVVHRDNHVRGNSDMVEERKICRKCYVCGKDVAGYVKHLEDEHKDFKPHSCKMCDNSFHTQMQLKKHLFTHIEVATFECMGCNKLFKNTTFLRNHIVKEKHSTDMYHCPHCGLGTLKFKTLNDHFKKEHYSQYSKQLFPCFLCKKVFSFNKHVLKHECAGSKKHPKPSEKYKCDGCGLQFSCEDELVCHTFTLCESRFTCSIPGCGKVFSHRRGISDHVREAHERQSSFVCDQCGFSTHAARKLVIHRAKHNPEPADQTLFKCPHPGCDSVLKSKCSLLTHKSIHQERRYECYLCQKKFRFYPTLRDHMATHMTTDELRPFGCDFCSQRFIRARDKRRHLKIHTGERPNVCSLCAATFRDIGTLNQHFRRVHTSLCFKCKFCEKTYKDKAKLREHLFVHRGFKPFNCPSCPQQFVKKYLFVKHLLMHNIIFDENIHGYKEMENLDHVFANSMQRPSTPPLIAPVVYETLPAQPPPPVLHNETSFHLALFRQTQQQSHPDGRGYH